MLYYVLPVIFIILTSFFIWRKKRTPISRNYTICTSTACARCNGNATVLERARNEFYSAYSKTESLPTQLRQIHKALTEVTPTESKEWSFSVVLIVSEKLFCKRWERLLPLRSQARVGKILILKNKVTTPSEWRSLRSFISIRRLFTTVVPFFFNYLLVLSFAKRYSSTVIIITETLLKT